MPNPFRRGALALLLMVAAPVWAQVVPWATEIRATPDAEKLPEDRGAAGLAQTLKKLGTWASLMMIVAHPDDEDGGMMTYESRGHGVRTTLMTLTRGEGGQNAMSGDSYDALGLIRTSELLLADQYSGTEQVWGQFADYGFSKTKDEALAAWGRDRVLCNVVREVRMRRPLVLVSVFAGGVTDGHGHHQVAGEMAQEAYVASGDAGVCPEQIAAGLRPWKPLAVFARTPFAPVNARGMYDYATGKWAPARFYNYVTKEWTTTEPAADVTIEEGTEDPVLGRTYVQISREGWGQQRSQYGGGTPPLPGPSQATYHRYGSRIAASGRREGSTEEGFFAGIDTSLAGMAGLAHGDDAFLLAGLRGIEQSVDRARESFRPSAPEEIAPELRDVYRQTKALKEQVEASALSASEKADLAFELGIKLAQVNTALAEALGLEVHALMMPLLKGADAGAGRSASIYPSSTATHVSTGEKFEVRVHATGSPERGKQLLRLSRTWVSTPEGEHWETSSVRTAGSDALWEGSRDDFFQLAVPKEAAVTEPYFSRSSIDQPVYTVHDASLLGTSFAPYPVAGWAEFSYDGVPVRVGQVVQTASRVPGRGMVYEPLVVTPRLSVRLADRVAVTTPGKHSLNVTAMVTNEQAAGSLKAEVRLQAPAGWQVEPRQAVVDLAPGEQKEQGFVVSLPEGARGTTMLTATAQAEGESYMRGFATIGYPGLRPYNLYQAATVAVKPIDVRLPEGLRIGYVMGTGDDVPQALAQLGVAPHLISAEELRTGDLGRYDTIVLGVRTYLAQPALARTNGRLLEWVKAGGTLVVQYQGPEFDHEYGPYPLRLAAGAKQPSERVVDERAPVRLLTPEDPLLSWPNRITAADFSGWLEERGHGFAGRWDSRYAAPTETADPEQDPQRGGLLHAQFGRGQYIYVAYALYRQLPEGVAGAYRLLANLVAAGHRQNAGGARMPE